MFTSCSWPFPGIPASYSCCQKLGIISSWKWLKLLTLLVSVALTDAVKATDTINWPLLPACVCTLKRTWLKLQTLCTVWASFIAAILIVRHISVLFRSSTAWLNQVLKYFLDCWEVSGGFHHFSVLLCLLWEFMNVAQVGEPIEGGGEFQTCQHKRIL